MKNPIRTRRTGLGLTQGKLALTVGVSPGLVAQWERGDLMPPATRIKVLAELLGVDERRLSDGLSAFQNHQRREATKKLEDALVA